MIKIIKKIKMNGTVSTHGTNKGSWTVGDHVVHGG
jgi:hypothetical protein